MVVYKSVKDYAKATGKKVTTTYGRGTVADKQKSSSSKSSSSKKTIVIYDQTGKVTQSNDPSKPVGSVDSTKKRESVLKSTPDYRGASVSYRRDGSKITEEVSRGGKVVSSRVVQDATTPRSQRTTTSRLASQVRGISQAQVSQAKNRAIRRAYARINDGNATSKDKLLAIFGTDKPSLANLNAVLRNPEQRKQAKSIIEVDNYMKRSLANARTVPDDYLAPQPIFTVGSALRIAGQQPATRREYKFFKNSQGQVIGIEDPFAQQTYQIKPTSPLKLAIIFTDRQLTKEFFAGQRLQGTLAGRNKVQSTLDADIRERLNLDFLEQLRKETNKTKNPVRTLVQSLSTDAKNYRIKLLGELNKNPSLNYAQRIARWNDRNMRLGNLAEEYIKINQKSNISWEDYQKYKKSIEGVYGTEALIGKINTRYDNNMHKGTLNGLLLNLKDIGKFTLNSAYIPIEATYIVLKDIYIIGSFGVKGIKKAGSFVKGIAIDQVKDTSDIINRRFKDGEKTRLYNRALKSVNDIKKFGKNTAKVLAWIKNHPAETGVFLVTAVALGLISLRDFAKNNPRKFASEVVSLVFEGAILGGVGKTLGVGGKISKSKYVQKLKDPLAKLVTSNILKAGEKVKKGFKKTKLGSFDFIEIAKNKYINSALVKTFKETKAVVYGSKLEYELKAKYLQDFFKKQDGKSYTKSQAIKRYKDIMKKSSLKAEEIDDILGIPKDLDLVVDTRYIGKFVRAYTKKYEYIPELLQKYLKNDRRFPKDFELSKIRADKTSVFSILSKTQIDDLLRGLTTNAETTAFKIRFLENLYKSPVGRKLIKKMDLSGTGLKLESLGFGLDIHTSNEVAFTKSFLGLIRKTDIPLELPIKKRFLSTLKESVIEENRLLDAKDLALTKLSKRYQTMFNKYGLKLNVTNFKKNLPKFLDSSEIRIIQEFDFLQLKKKANVNKAVLNTYYNALRRLGMTPDSISTIKQTNNLVLQLNFIKNTLDFTKRASKVLNKFDADLDYLKAQREVLLYYSKKGKEAFNKVSGFDIKGLKLKKTFSEAEQKKLLKIVADYQKELRQRYSKANVEKLLTREVGSLSKYAKKRPKIIKIRPKQIGNQAISKIRTKKGLSKYAKLKQKNIPKEIIDLEKSVERDLALVKGFRTERIKVTKDGIRYISPNEQVKRRVAGAVSTLFEDRRAKDILKTYNNIRFLESVRAIQLAKINKKGKVKAIVDKLKLTDKKLRQEIRKYQKLAKELTTDVFRKEKAFTTKGVSETTGIFPDKISFERKSVKVDKFVNNELKITRTEVNSKLQKYSKKQITQAKLKEEIDALVKRKLLAKARKNKIKITSASLVKIPKLRNYLITSYTSLSRSVSRSRPIRSLSVSKSKSTSKSKAPSKSRSVSRSKSKSASRSASKSLSRSASKSASTSTSKSASRSASKSLSRSASKSASRSLSRSISKAPPVKPVKIPKLSWNNPSPRGYSYIVQPYIKSRGRILKVGKPTSQNRGLKRARDYVDNRLVQSMELRIVGLRKIKDINTPSLVKFRKKVSSDPKVLQLVEKNRYHFDKPKEKVNIRRARRVVNKRRPVRKKPTRRKK